MSPDARVRGGDANARETSRIRRTGGLACALVYEPCMKVHAAHAVLALVAATALAACSADSKPEETDRVKEARSSLQRDRAPNVDPATLSQVTRDGAAFGLDLHKQLVNGAAKGKNLFYSAHSVSSAFAMLHAGARGATEQEIAKVLHFTVPQNELHPAMNKVALELESREADGGKGSDGKGFRLNMHNTFWGEQTLTWEAPYLDTLAVHYDAGINLVDFIGHFEQARLDINAWTEKKTEGRIKELLPEDSLDPSTRFALVNTVYFNAAWTDEFAPTTMIFATPDGASNVAAIQRVGGTFSWAQTDDAELVAIPYEGRKLELVVVVPTDLEAFEAKLDGTLLDSIIAKLEPAYLDVTMPKVKIEGDTINLKNELIALGMTTLRGGADFSGMTSTQLQVTDVFHKAFVKIDEKGTEAAAATAIIGRESSAPVDPPKKVMVDKPYLFFVRDVPTGVVLFTGRVVAPEYGE
jgi:serpin B